MCVRLNPGPVPPRARPRSAASEKAKFLKKFVDTMADAGMAVTTLGAPFPSPAMAMVKSSSIEAPKVFDNIDIDPGIGTDGPPDSQKKTIKYRLVIDCRVINASTVPDPFPVPRLQSLGLLQANQSFFMSLDIFRGFWQIPLDVASQDVFTFVTPDGLWKPTRMPQGCRNATFHFQRIMPWVLGDLVGTICAVYVDDIVLWGKTKLELANNLVLILEKLKLHRVHALAKKSVFFTTEVKWFGKLYSAEGPP